MSVCVLVPSSLLRETGDKREATRKIGYVARAATVFGATRLVVFPDPEGERNATWDGGFVETVLRYAATPPSLRKEHWDARDELEFAGVLPPLRATSRTGSGSNDSGSLRQGIVTEVGPDGRVRVNCGMQHPIALHVPPELTVAEGERVTVRVTSRQPVRARIVSEPSPAPRVERTELTAALAAADAGVRIATSRHGEALTVTRLRPLAERIQADGMTVAFGAPERGLLDILEDVAPAASPPTHPPSGSADGFDHWINAIPDQGSEVVRTEEAMFAVLACLTLTE